MISSGKKRVVQISLFVAFLVFIVAGIMRKEVYDIITNATLICLSCIGLK